VTTYYSQFEGGKIVGGVGWIGDASSQTAGLPAEMSPELVDGVERAAAKEARDEERKAAERKAHYDDLAAGNPFKPDERHDFATAMQANKAWSDQADVHQDNRERERDGKILSGELFEPARRETLKRREERAAREAKWQSYTPEEKAVVKDYIKDGLARLVRKGAGKGEWRP
jgi:hypothetical protein